MKILLIFLAAISSDVFAFLRFLAGNNIESMASVSCLLAKPIIIAKASSLGPSPKPTLPPQAPRPLAIPTTEFQNPREPVTPPLPVKGSVPPQPNPLRSALTTGINTYAALTD